MLRILIAIACIAVLACGTEAPMESVTRTVADEGLEHSVVIDKGPEPQVAESAKGPEPQVEVEPTQVPETEQELVVEASAEYSAHLGASVASLEERAYLADVIVRATLVSADNDVLTFTAVEYLKGGGPTSLTVSAATANRNTRWDDNEAILFLSTPSGGEESAGAQSSAATFEFTDTTTFDYTDGKRLWGTDPISYSGKLGDGYTIDSANPVWTPAKQTGDVDGAGGDIGSREYISASTSTLGEALPTFTLAELKEIIAWVTGGEGIEGYGDCVLESLWNIRTWRDFEAHEGPFVPNEHPLYAESGVVGVNLLQGGTTDSRSPYKKLWLEGDNAKYFSNNIVDDDDDPSNGYGEELVAVRPLPAGEYRVWTGVQLGEYQACNYIPSSVGVAFSFNVIVIAPEGTVYEALFDPADLSPGIGFSSTAGSLTSPGFSVRVWATIVTGITWESGSVVLTLNPFVSLEGHNLHFIELDGSVGLTLEGSSAVEDPEASTLAWTVADQPWEMGDQLMLRIRSQPDTTSPIPAPDAEILSAGAGHSCGLWPDGEVVCWGNDESGQSSPPPGERFASISVGSGHTCGLRADGRAVCWGWNDGGQATPPEDERFISISAGSHHTCGLREDGVAVCWGWNDGGQATPPEDERFVVVDAGSSHTCGLREDGAAVCWGSDSHGASSPPEGDRFVAISAGDDHTCGLRADGETWCWGLLGKGWDRRPRPTGDRFVAITAGDHHVCGLRGDGSAVCWGDDQYGQSTPPESERFVAIAGGEFHTCGMRADGEAVCWGSGYYGESTPPRD